MKVLVICPGISGNNINMQPWVYIIEICKHLKNKGLLVEIATDKPLSKDSICGIKSSYIRSFSCFPFRPNKKLLSHITTINPDLLLWNTGYGSFLYSNLPGCKIPMVSIFTSPLYKFSTLLSLPINAYINEFEHVVTHLANTFISRLLRLKKINNFCLHITMNKTTKSNLLSLGIPEESIHTIPPGVGKEYLESSETLFTREDLGIDSNCFIVTYMGGPLLIRGIDLAVKGFSHFSKSFCKNAVLIILSRGKMRDSLRRLISNHEHIILIERLLTPEEISSYIKISNVVLLPFRIIPSDSPLAIYESLSLGIPVVGTYSQDILVGDTGLNVHIRERDITDALFKIYKDKLVVIKSSRNWETACHEVYGLLSDRFTLLEPDAANKNTTSNPLFTNKG